MKKTVIRFGLYGALTICVLFLLAWFLADGLSYSNQELIGYASMVIALSFVFFGIKHYRDTENQGSISFKKGLLVGIAISFITALAFGILDVIYVEFLNPGFMEDYYQHSLEQMQDTLSAEDFELKKVEMEAQKELFSNPFMTFILMGMTVFVIGFIISLISALILQRK